MNTQNIVITVDEENWDRIKQVAAELSQAGLKVKEIHETIGIITGSVSVSLRSKLTDIKGVAAVEDERTVQLPPPDSKIQ